MGGSDSSTTIPSVVFEWTGDSELGASTPRPKPAVETIPDWYEKIPAKHGLDSTVKLCASFGDALKIGYSIPLPFTLEFTRTDSELQLDISDGDVGHDCVNTYGVSENERPEENSKFKPPEFSIDIPWNIHTPDGYSTLLTVPLNHVDSGIKPYSLFVPTDEETQSISVPVSSTRPFGSIEKGTSFLRVIPIRRETVLSDATVTDEHDRIGGEISAGYETNSELINRSSGFYRREVWKPKKTEEITDTVTDGEAPLDTIEGLVGDPGAIADELGSVQTALRYVIREYNQGVVPEPVPLSDDLPRWMRESSDFSNVSETETQISEWARDAMDLGWYIPLPADSVIDSTGDSGVTVTTAFDALRNDEIGDEPLFTPHDREQLGDSFPIDWIELVKIIAPSIVRPPKGYSLLICEPFNHWQYPFQSTSGLTDVDEMPIRSTSIGLFLLPNGTFEMSMGSPTTMNMPIHRDSLIKHAYVIDSVDGEN